ncbi:hypothetical protein [Macrococcus capreoli]|uniref:hypothetical protein n=1 Tax=Macrococcus capreoli TaxID=2982690 RepID=UPI0021D580A6|nr:hypothetical protein [Macrococcus sp. TMW 2.2395]MCU7557556.1 hypothetical protein [Macrococcus sp. TMW 2.2395]
MELIITLSANIGELSTLKQKNVMNKKAEIDSLFHEGVNIDINHERITIVFQNINDIVLRNDDFLKKMSDIFKLILESLLIENYYHIDLLLTDIIEKNIKNEKIQNELSEIDRHIIGVGKEYRYNDDNFEIRFKYEPNYTPIKKGDVYKTHILGSKHGIYNINNLRSDLSEALRIITIIDEKLLENYINENE